MERKEVVDRLGKGTRVVIVRPRSARKNTAWMRLQVRRRIWGWRTLSAYPVAIEKATRREAEQWMLDYDEYPPGHFRRYP